MAVETNSQLDDPQQWDTSRKDEWINDRVNEGMTAEEADEAFHRLGIEHMLKNHPLKGTPKHERLCRYHRRADLIVSPPSEQAPSEQVQSDEFATSTPCDHEVPHVHMATSIEPIGSDSQTVSNVSGDADDEATEDVFHDPHAVGWIEPPVETLGEFLASLLIDRAERIQCNVANVLLPALPTLAQLIGDTYAMRLKDGWIEPCILWSGTIAKSGSKKSPVYAWVTGPTKAIEKELRRVATDDDLPIRLSVSNFTNESLVPLLAENPRGLHATADELTVILSRPQYQKGGSDNELLLSAFSGWGYCVDRKTDREHIVVDQARLCISGNITPGNAQKLLGGDDSVDQGLTSRFLLAYPPRRRARYLTDPPDTRKGDWDQLCRKLWRLSPKVATVDERAPHELALHPDSVPLFARYHDAMEMLIESEKSDFLCLSYSKRIAVCARIAIVLHCVDAVVAGKPIHPEIAPETMQRAITLTQWFNQESRRIRGLWFGNASTEVIDTKAAEYRLGQIKPLQRMFKTMKSVEKPILVNGKKPEVKDWKFANGQHSISTKWVANNCKPDIKGTDEARAYVDGLVEFGIADWLNEDRTWFTLARLNKKSPPIQ